MDCERRDDYNIFSWRSRDVDCDFYSKMCLRRRTNRCYTHLSFEQTKQESTSESITNARECRLTYNRNEYNKNKCYSIEKIFHCHQNRHVICLHWDGWFVFPAFFLRRMFSIFVSVAKCSTFSRNIPIGNGDGALFASLGVIWCAHTYIHIRMLQTFGIMNWLIAK